MGSLSEYLRPTCLEQVVGQDHAKKAIAAWINKDDFPRCQLYTGPVGTGKSTLAQIVARACQGPDGWEGADIRQINAGTVGKVDDMRALAAESDSSPFLGRYRVFILEECHRATDSAQDAILVPMETNPSTLWILTSSEPAKLLPAIRSRCSAATFELKPLGKGDLTILVSRIWVDKNLTDGQAMVDFLWDKQILAPREVLGVLDQYLAGVPLANCVHGSAHEPLYKDVASAVLSGNWTRAAGLLSQIKTADSRGMTAMVSAFLRNDLLKQGTGPKADALATCLVGIDNIGFADGTAYGAVIGLLYKTTKALGGQR